MFSLVEVIGHVRLAIVKYKNIVGAASPDRHICFIVTVFAINAWHNGFALHIGCCDQPSVSTHYMKFKRWLKLQNHNAVLHSGLLFNGSIVKIRLTTQWWGIDVTADVTLLLLQSFLSDVFFIPNCLFQCSANFHVSSMFGKSSIHVVEEYPYCAYAVHISLAL